jgi:hypothetical protein
VYLLLLLLKHVFRYVIVSWLVGITDIRCCETEIISF